MSSLVAMKTLHGEMGGFGTAVEAGRVRGDTAQLALEGSLLRRRISSY